VLCLTGWFVFVQVKHASRIKLTVSLTHGTQYSSLMVSHTLCLLACDRVRDCKVRLYGFVGVLYNALLLSCPLIDFLPASLVALSHALLLLWQLQ